jgi:predicted CXXCH cytochrome family protein
MHHFVTMVIVWALALLLCSPVFSAEDSGMIELPAFIGRVMFPHQKHQMWVQDCSQCHTQGIGKIPELGKEWAHKTCRGCHADRDKGPISCRDCHGR